MVHEGMAEYLSIGPRSAYGDVDPRRVEKGTLPEIQDLDNPKYFLIDGPGVWAYIGGTYGECRCPDLPRRAAFGNLESR